MAGGSRVQRDQVLRQKAQRHVPQARGFGFQSCRLDIQFS